MVTAFQELVSQNSNLHFLHFRCFISCLGGVVYTKSVKESEEINCISLQSPKRSFCKLQFF